MFQKIVIAMLFAALAFGFYKSSDFTLIISGVAIFLLGMLFTEGGFKAFSGSILESILKKSTSSLGMSIFSGFFSTSVVQSSSLISVIAISFLSAELITLRESLGVIFGANIGSTTTAWLVSAFGLKIKISAYALPMISFGVILKFMKSKINNGFGDILLGLGLLFLGISDMKDGFEAIKESVDLSQFAIAGFFGLIVYIGVGMFATAVIQSSAATMALAIAALASGQITYENALALAIGSNVGTTITAMLGAMASNADGKRLAVAHLIFNIQTGVVAVIFLYPIIKAVDYIAHHLSIAPDEYTLKLALFHTVFNIIGVLIMIPVVDRLVKYLNTLFKKSEKTLDSPHYINSELVGIPAAAISALEKETEHVLDNAYVILAHSINVHRSDIYSDKPIDQIIAISIKKLPIDIEVTYQERVKSLFSEIISFSTLAQEVMNESDKLRIRNLMLANRKIVEAIKDIELIHNNIYKYTVHSNKFIKEEYNSIRSMLASSYREIHRFTDEANRETTRLESYKIELEGFDMAIADRLVHLIKEKKITNMMATSLMNDSAFAYSIVKNLLLSAELLWFDNAVQKNLSLNHDEIKEIIDISKNDEKI